MYEEEKFLKKKSYYPECFAEPLISDPDPEDIF